MRGRRERPWWQDAAYRAVPTIFLLGLLLSILWAPNVGGSSHPRPRSLEIVVLESIDLGDVLVADDDLLEVEVAADGRRRGSAGPAAFGSLPYGSGRLQLLGEPGACVHLASHSFAGRGRGSGARTLEVRRVLLRSPRSTGREEIELRLDPHGVAEVEVGVELRVRDVRQSRRWSLELAFEARYAEAPSTAECVGP